MVKTATIFGASGGLARALISQLLESKWHIVAVCRSTSVNFLKVEFTSFIDLGCIDIISVENSYSEFVFTRNTDLIFFTQAIFEPKSLVEMDALDISNEIAVGLRDPIVLTNKFLNSFPSINGKRRDICFIGSTSSYAGYKNTSVYCSIKHALLGFVRALNDEYSGTDDRFRLFSMGTMLTSMGLKVSGQDPTTFLNPFDVAARIISTLQSDSNLFEPEVIIRRRSIGFL